MILFLWSIVAGAVGYLKKQRMAQWVKTMVIESRTHGKQLILRRLSSPVVQRPWRHHPGKFMDENGDSLLLWNSDSVEIRLSQASNSLEPEWWRVYDGLPHSHDVCKSELICFTAISKPAESGQPSTSEENSNSFNIEAGCTALAWRTDGDQVTVLFGCSIDQFADVACAWIYDTVVFRDTFEVEEIATETLSLEFAVALGLETSSTPPSSTPVQDKCNGSINHGFKAEAKIQAITTLALSTTGCCSRTVHTITTTANGGKRLLPGTEENLSQQRGLSRSSVLCSLEQLCLSDILAAKDLCRSLGAFDGDHLTPGSPGGASVYYTCNRDFVEAGTSDGVVSQRGYGTSSIGSSRMTLGGVGEEDEDMEDRNPTGTISLTPLGVDIFDGGPDFLSTSTDHLSPCHGFNDRLLDRRWYSTWRCDSLDSSIGGGVITRQPSRSSSSSKRKSAHSGGTASRSKSSAGDALDVPTNMSRRWSLPSPPQRRARSGSTSKSRFQSTPNVKPPNVLIYTGENDSTNDSYSRLEAVIGRSIHGEKYVIYRLKRSQFLTDPWPNNAVCIIVAETSGLDNNCWQRLFDYFKAGGKMFFVCENRLLASLNDVGSAKKRYGLLKLAFGANEQNRNHKDFKEFLKRLSKALKKPSVCEHFNVLGSDGRPKFTLSFVREESTPLILYMQNAQDRAVALFSDVTMDSVLTAGRSIIHEILQRLGLELSTTEEIPKLSSGYLIYESEEAQEQSAPELISLGRIDDGRTSIEFFDSNTVPPDRVAATRVYLPVWINARVHSDNFNATAYFEHLGTKELGRCVLYVPVATSTMNYFEGLLAKLPENFAVVAIAKHQLEGQGRGGNRFLSPDGCAMFTIGLRVPSHSRLAESPGYVQHLLALAAVDSICSYREELANFHLRLKWPNDIYYGIGRLVKIGGVLVNCLARGDTLFFVAGLGLNVANANPTTCINDLLPPEIPAFTTEQVIALTLTRFEKLMHLFERRGHDGILPLYYKYWLHNYQELTIAETSERVIVRGLDKRGYLEVRSRQSGQVFNVQPNGNTFDMMHNLIKIKDS